VVDVFIRGRKKPVTIVSDASTSSIGAELPPRRCTSSLEPPPTELTRTCATFGFSPAKGSEADFAGVRALDVERILVVVVHEQRQWSRLCAADYSSKAGRRVLPEYVEHVEHVLPPYRPLLGFEDLQEDTACLVNINASISLSLGEGQALAGVRLSFAACKLCSDRETPLSMSSFLASLSLVGYFEHFCPRGEQILLPQSRELRSLKGLPAAVLPPPELASDSRWRALCEAFFGAETTTWLKAALVDAPIREGDAPHRILMLQRLAMLHHQQSSSVLCRAPWAYSLPTHTVEHLCVLAVVNFTVASEELGEETEMTTSWFAPLAACCDGDGTRAAFRIDAGAHAAGSTPFATFDIARYSLTLVDVRSGSSAFLASTLDQHDVVYDPVDGSASARAEALVPVLNTAPGVAVCENHGFPAVRIRLSWSRCAAPQGGGRHLLKEMELSFQHTDTNLGDNGQEPLLELIAFDAFCSSLRWTAPIKQFNERCV